MPLFVKRTLHGSDTTFTVALLRGQRRLADRCAAHRTQDLDLGSPGGHRGGHVRSVDVAAGGGARHLGVALPIAMLMGLTSIMFMTASTAIVQMRADPAMRGRVLALQAIVFLGTTPIGGPLLGLDHRRIRCPRRPCCRRAWRASTAAAFGELATRRAAHSPPRPTLASRANSADLQLRPPTARTPDCCTYDDVVHLRPPLRSRQHHPVLGSPIPRRWPHEPGTDRALERTGTTRRHGVGVGRRCNGSQSSETLPLVRQLAGHKRLLAGNHDRCWNGHGPRAAEWIERYEEAAFEEIHQGSIELNVGGHDVLACHFPYRGDSQDEDRYPEARPTSTRAAGCCTATSTSSGGNTIDMINVGCDAWACRPIDDCHHCRLSSTLVGTISPPLSVRGRRTDLKR